MEIRFLRNISDITKYDTSKHKTNTKHFGGGLVELDRIRSRDKLKQNSLEDVRGGNTKKEESTSCKKI